MAKKQEVKYRVEYTHKEVFYSYTVKASKLKYLIHLYDHGDIEGLSYTKEV